MSSREYQRAYRAKHRERLREQNKAYRLDHCHKSGAVRGLLCLNCNTMIGHAHDDPAKLESGARYLRERGDKCS